MAMAETAEYTFGPPISVSIDIADEHKPVDVDLPRVSQNLAKDFPERSQDDWSNLMVYLCDDLPKGLAGYAGLVGHYRKSRFCRTVRRVREKLPGYPYLPYSKVRGVTVNEDILVVVQIDPNLEGEDPYAQYYDDPSKALPHEIKHGADRLQGSLGEEDVRSHEREAKIYLARASSFTAGSVAFVSGAIEMGIKSLEIDVKLPTLLGGFALMVAALYRIDRKKATDANPMLAPDPRSEQAAHAYSIGTEASWAGVIKTGEESAGNQADDWFSGLPGAYPWKS